MPTRPLAFLALCFPVLAAAQDFRLEDYEPAPFRRHYLSLTPGVSWQSNTNRQDGDTLRMESSTGSGSPSLGASFGSQAWDPSREWKLAANVRVAGSGYGSRNRTGPEGDRQPDPSDGGWQGNGGASLGGSADAAYRKYLGRRWFLEPSARGSLDHNPRARSRGRAWDRSFLYAPSDSAVFTYRTFRSSWYRNGEEASLGFAIGFGRIREVGFAATGLFMLEHLPPGDAAAAHMDLQGMRELEAYLEERRKARPFLDRRRAAIYDMASVNRFLEGRGGARIPAEALLAMADEWSNPSPIPRRSGWEAKTYPFIRGSWADNRGWDEQKTWSEIRPGSESERASVAAATAGPEDRYGVSRSRSFQGARELGWAAAWEFQKPWRRHFQFGMGADSRYSEIREELGSSYRTNDWPFPGTAYSAYLEQRYTALAGKAEATAAWIPGSRSWTQASWSARAGWKGNQAPINAGLAGDASARTASTRIALEEGYEVAPRLAFAGTLAWEGSWSDGFRRELAYPEYAFRAFRREDRASSWNWDFQLRYYLF
jgi:hypothetical protein